MALDTKALTEALQSHAMASGWFDDVNGHEPHSIPGHGLTCAVWAQAIRPAPRRSGLQATSGVVVFNVRVYHPIVSEPFDAIDPAMCQAVDALMAAYSADFTLGGRVEAVDLLGAAGAGALSAEAGYVEPADGAVFRTMTITVPCRINDLWEQSP